MASTPPPPPYTTDSHNYNSIVGQQTMPVPALPDPLVSPIDTSGSSIVSTAKKNFKHIFPVVIGLALVIIIYFVWNSSTPAPPSTGPSVTQQNFGNSSPSTTNSSIGSGDIQVYVVGAVKHPGVYTLPAKARVYQLLQAAGGPLPRANLVALNLAATLTDGEEVYVTLIGETPPTYLGGVPGAPGAQGSNISGSSTAGQLVNINTASVDEMRQSLHLSSTTAQNIVNYRLQHGPFTSIDQLLQVVSRSIYDKIKAQVTVS